MREAISSNHCSFALSDGNDNPARHYRRLYKNRCRIENAFARLKDWRGIAIRYTRCGDFFLSAIVLAASVIFWLPL